MVAAATDEPRSWVQAKDRLLVDADFPMRMTRHLPKIASYQFCDRKS